MTSVTPPTRASASPYATGGGGTVLEHRYGAVLLAHLLAADPLTELGDDATVTRVEFQVAAVSPVDDVKVVGRAPDGTERQVTIAVRRAPDLVPSDDTSVSLIGTYLPILATAWPAVRSGTWRLALAATPTNPVRELGLLAAIAAVAPDEATFRKEVARAGRTTAAVRARLEQLDKVVAEAAARGNPQPDEPTPGELTWRLLWALTVRELRLEAPDQSDRTRAVAALRAVTVDGSVSAADQLFSRLAELVDDYAPAAATVDEAVLRRDLAGFAELHRSAHHAAAWRLLDGVAERLRSRTGTTLSDAAGQFEVDRATERALLADALVAAGAARSTLLITGEPDVGKSSLTLRAVESARSADVADVTLNLRDLPPTAIEADALLGAPLHQVLGGAAVRAARIVVIDGAEAALEGRDDLLLYVATAALQAGLGVAAVTRTDGQRVVADILQHARAAAARPAEGTEHVVGGFADDAMARTVERFPVLTRIASDRRAAWLLSRPGLIDLLLRAGATMTLPTGALSEADVFAAVWSQLVRRGERSPTAGSTPDDRERALASLARQLLQPSSGVEAPPAQALASLRSDGLLLSAGLTGAWSPGDQFASDLVRDLAVAWVLRADGPSVLTAAAPRWALRAARLACQAALLAAGDEIERVRRDLKATFDALAVEHGTRWSEVPLEAMLTLGAPSDALAAAWPAMVSDQATDLMSLVRLALNRYTRFEVGDVHVLGPLVELIYDHQADLHAHRDATLNEKVSELILAWLRGLVIADVYATDHVRVRFRDVLLSTPLDNHDEFQVEALALLGGDLDDRAEARLRYLADQWPGFLAPAVESTVAVRSLVQHDVELLATLTEAYYIERPRSDPWWSGYDLFDNGVRHHEQAGGFGEPMWAWYYGPFWTLLAAHPAVGMRTINRILDHAVTVRGSDPGDDRLPGLDLHLPGVGLRHCLGDTDTWGWYRGLGAAPPACVSALLATEQFADEVLRRDLFPLRRLCELLVLDCHNLAMPALVLGLLVRHIERTTDDLDVWLARPELWQLEAHRVTGDQHFPAAGRAPEDTTGIERRAYTLHEVAAYLVLAAILNRNEERIAQLRAVGESLIRHTRAAVLGPERADDNSQDYLHDDLLAVVNYATKLDAANYGEVTLEDGSRALMYQQPQPVVTAFAPSNTEYARVMAAYRLLNAYARAEDRAASFDTIRDDLAVARGLLADPPRDGPPDPADAPVGAAATSLVACARGIITLDEDDFRWAAELVVAAAVRPVADDGLRDFTMDPSGTDRSAAAAVPLLLIPAMSSRAGCPPRKRREPALRACTTSPFDEVRRVTAGALAAVWLADCAPSKRRRRCHHAVALDAVEAGARDCLRGPPGPTGRRERPLLRGDLPPSLDDVEADSLMVNRLAAPIIAAADAVASGCCVASDAQRLLDALLRAHARGMVVWVEAGYHHTAQDHQRRVANVLFQIAARGDIEPLLRHVRSFAGHPAPLAQLLRELMRVATYDAELRARLSDVWPVVMQTVLDTSDTGTKMHSRRKADDAVANLIPRPEPDLSDPDRDATLSAAATDWIHPDYLAPLMRRWLPLARHDPQSVDALVRFATTTADEWQATTGLAWVVALIGDDVRHVARQCWRLPGWLGQVRRSQHLAGDGVRQVQRIIDGLVTHDDPRAVALQRAEE